MTVAASSPKSGVDKKTPDVLSSTPSVKGFPTGAPEAGIHIHALERENKRTKVDGAHQHLFILPDNIVIATEEDGEHDHVLWDETVDEASWDGEHFHRITLPDGTVLETEHIRSTHSHELQVDVTAFDGIHIHGLKLPGGNVIESLRGGEFWDRIGRPAQAGGLAMPAASEIARLTRGLAGKVISRLQSFKLASPVLVLADGNLHVIGADAEVCKAVEAAVGEMLPPDIGQTLKVLSGAPTGDFVEVADLVVQLRPSFVAKLAHPKKPKKKDKRIVERDGEFCAVSEDGERNFGCFATRAEAADRLGEVEAFKDVDGVPGVLTWKTVCEGRMPPTGLSLLPEPIEKLVPDAFHYWKHEGDKAREIRDALFDTGLITSDSVRLVDGLPHLVEKKLYLVEPSDVDMTAELVVGTFVNETSRLVGKACVMWSVDDDFPASFEIGEDHILVFDPEVTKKWVDDEGIDALAKKVSALECKFFLPVPDSVGARHALSKIGNDCQPFTVRRSAMANLLFVSNVKVAKKHVELLEIAHVEFDREEEFELLKQNWGDHELWHLRMGTERWVLQEDPTKSASLSMLKSAESTLQGEIEKLDSGRAVYLDDFGDRRRMRLDGKILSGVCSFEQLGGSPIWNFNRPDAGGASDTPVGKSYEVREFLFKAEDEDERFVLGIVLEPETRDAQNDIYSAEEIRNVAHAFMAKFQNIGIMHQTLSKNVQILESYITPVEFEIDNRTIQKGTWLLATRILSDKLWKAVKDGTFGGYSIGGSAIRTPV